MTVVPDGRLCACGNRGCWEMYASGRALARDARELAADSPVAAARMLELAGSIDAIDGPVVSAAAAEGDPAALSICTTMGRWLGHGPGQPRRGARPVDVRHRRRSVGGRRAAARPRAAGVPRTP